MSTTKNSRKMRVENVYLLSDWNISPKSLGFMERDMISGGIKYGIVKGQGKYALVRDAKGLKGMDPSIVEFDKWHKPFKKRTSLEN